MSDPPNGPQPSPGESPLPDSGHAAPTRDPSFRFPLPFDPVRLLAGVLSRWPWIVLGVALFGTMGTMIGIQITQPSFAISASLIKRRVPQTVQTSEIGQAYRPVDLNDATLLATLLATEPLDLALRRSKNQIPPNQIKFHVEASQLEGTDIFYITYHSPISPEDAISFSSLWAEEISAYTQRLQQAEAQGVRSILQKEVADLEKQIRETDTEILNFCQDHDYVGGVAQVSAALAKLGQIELQLETARTTVETKNHQLESLTAQIQRQSPLESQLKTASEELAALRATYTDANPLVQSKLQSIEYLSGQIKSLSEKGRSELDSYTGTDLGNELYLTILELGNEKHDATSQIRALEKLYRSTSERIAQFPEIISSYDALQKKREALAQGLSLMSNRLQEAKIFASGAPGYWQVFQGPDPRSIVRSSLVKKPLTIGIASGVAGGGLAVLLTLLLTQRTSRRSILECCSAAQAAIACNIPANSLQDATEATEQFWLTHLAPKLDTSGPVLFWTPAADLADEQRFWTLLASVVKNDTGQSLRVHDLTPDTLWDATDLPEALEWTPVSPPSHPIVLRASSLPHGSARELLSDVQHWLSLVSGNQDAIRRAVQFRKLSDAYLPPCGGTIGWTERPDGPVRSTADHVSHFLARKFS